jgi:heat-inducible transcriptional repressor
VENDRSKEILNSIVRSYIATGQPVASAQISRMRRHPMSPATVRNVMADLTEEGFLSQPHTSAGRVPTEKAYREYVASLGTRLVAGELDRIRQRLTAEETLESMMQQSSHLLREMTHGMGIAAAIPAGSQVLDQIDFVALGPRRVLVILVTRDKMVRNPVVALDEDVTGDELNVMRNYVNRHFSGMTLADVRRELGARLEETRAQYREALRKLACLYERGLLDVGLAPEVHVDGASSLASTEFYLTGDQLRELFEALEQKARVLELLERFLESSSQSVAAQIGLADAHPSMRGLSLVGTTVAFPSGVTARIAVLGPMRMDYERAVSAVRHLREAIQSLPS